MHSVREQPASAAAAAARTGGGPALTGEEELSCFKRFLTHDVQKVIISQYIQIRLEASINFCTGFNLHFAALKHI